MGNNAGTRRVMVIATKTDSRDQPLHCRAPARVNLIGEHTDYNDGFVLPTTTALYTSVSASLRRDRVIEVTSSSLDERRQFDLDNLHPSDDPQWIDYAVGVAAELEAMGLRIPGASLHVASEIPLGGGLSSSASFELAVADALLELAGTSLPKADIAKACRRAENRYAGVGCGIMDQYAVACCHRGSALLLDCRSLAAEQVAIPAGVGLLLTHSGVHHRLSDGSYNNRADECAEAVRILARDLPSVSSLRDVSLVQLDDWRDRLGDRLYRRCRHVISENQRVQDAVAALRTGDLAAFGQLLSASHASLRDDYAVSCSEVDRLVEIAGHVSGVAGSRMIGAGFGGCVLSVMPAADIDAATLQISESWARETGAAPWMHVVAAASPSGRYEPVREQE